MATISKYFFLKVSPLCIMSFFCCLLFKGLPVMGQNELSLYFGFADKVQFQNPDFQYGLERKITKKKKELGGLDFEKYAFIYKNQEGKKRYFEGMKTEYETFFLNTELTNNEVFENKVFINLTSIQFDLAAEVPNIDRIWLEPENKKDLKQPVINIFFNLFNQYHSEEKKELQLISFKKKNEYYFIIWKQLEEDLSFEALKRNYGLPSDAEIASLNSGILIPHHFFYLDISRLDDVEYFYNFMLDTLRGIEEAKEEFFLYLSNGQQPYFASNTENYEKVINKISVITPEMDGLHDFKVLKEKHFPAVFSKKGRQFFFHYYFSDESNLSTWKDKMINDIFAKKDLLKQPKRMVYLEQLNGDGQSSFELVPQESKK